MDLASSSRIALAEHGGFQRCWGDDRVGRLHDAVFDHKPKGRLGGVARGERVVFRPREGVKGLYERDTQTPADLSTNPAAHPVMAVQELKLGDRRMRGQPQVEGAQ